MLVRGEAEAERISASSPGGGRRGGRRGAAASGAAGAAGDLRRFVGPRDPRVLLLQAGQDSSSHHDQGDAMSMDDETLEALNGSIAKWQAIVGGTGEDEGAENCP